MYTADISLLLLGMFDYEGYLDSPVGLEFI